MNITSWKYDVVAKGRFGGFEAVKTSTGAVLVRALEWKGDRQPRIVLEPHSNGYDDWNSKLAPCRETHEIEHTAGVAENLYDQWLAH